MVEKKFQLLNTQHCNLGGGRRRAKKLKYSKIAEDWGMKQGGGDKAPPIGEEEGILIVGKEHVNEGGEPVGREQKAPCNSVKGRGMGKYKSTSTPSKTSSLLTDYFSNKRMMEQGAEEQAEFILDDSWEQMADDMMTRS